MVKTKPVKKAALILLFAAMAVAQDTRPTVAILDFESQGISEQEVKTLTERMRSEIGATNAVRLIERKAIENIMAEQGLAQSGCVTDECAAEVGQLLGVQFMINGSIGKIGDSFTIDVKMFSVETGTTERSSNVTHEGDIEGLLVEMQILAWNIVGLEAPTTAAPTTALPTSEAPTTQAISETLTLTDTTTKAASTTQAISETLTLTDSVAKAASTTQAITETVDLTDTVTKAASTSQAPKTQVGALVRGIAFPGLGHLYSNERKWAYLWMGAEAVMGALIYSTYSARQSATTDWNNYQQLYLNERNIVLIMDHKQNRDNSMADIEAANGQLALLAGIASSVWIANAVHAYLVGPGSEKKKKDKKEKKADPEPAVEEQALSRVDIKLVYDPALQQTQLKFSIPLH